MQEIKASEPEFRLFIQSRLYRSLIDAIAEGVVFQTADGLIRACNAAAERILGLSAEQMSGRSSLDPRWRAIHEDGTPWPGETHPVMLTLRTGEPFSNQIMGIHRPDGSLVWISVNSRAVFLPGQSRPYGGVATFAVLWSTMKICVCIPGTIKTY